MTVWHIILSLAFVAVVVIVALALPRKRRNPRDERFKESKDAPNQGMTVSKPQQEVTQRPAEEPRTARRGDTGPG